MSYSEKLASVFGVEEQTVRKIQDDFDPVAKTISSKLGKLSLWAVDEEERKALFSTVRLLDPKLVVETGVGSGVSSTCILSATPRCSLHSIDLGVKYGEEDRQYEVGFVVPDSLRNRWTLHLGDARTLLPKVLDQLGRIEMFFHDSTHTYEHVWFELSTAWPRIKRGVVVVDNSDWTKAPEDFARSVNQPLIQLTGDMTLIPKLSEQAG
ncbi:MAG: class I SAM-dependent methyltransferase [Thermoprotei archaeon]